MAENISSERVHAKRGLEDQAETMLKASNKKFKDAIVGQNVTVKIPDVDRGRNCPRNIIAVVLETMENGLYKLGTSDGVLKKAYSRNEFQLCSTSFVTVNECQPSSSLSLRTAAAVSSGSNQGFTKCNCNSKCDTKRCFCVKRGVLCNSKCHGSNPCKNK
jgi:hypothetical protein